MHACVVIQRAEQNGTISLEAWYPWDAPGGFRVEGAPLTIVSMHTSPLYMKEFLEGTRRDLAEIRASIPGEILEVVRAYRDTHHDLLCLACINPRAFLQLARSAPGIAYILARQVYRRTRQELRDVLSRKRRDILRFCGWPPQAWKLMAQTLPDTLDWGTVEQVCFVLHKRKRLIAILRHQRAPITREVVWLLTKFPESYLYTCPSLTMPGRPGAITLLEILELRDKLGLEGFPWRRIPHPCRVKAYVQELKLRWAKQLRGPLPNCPLPTPPGWRRIARAEEVAALADQFQNCLLTYMGALHRGDVFLYLEEPPQDADWPLVVLVEGLYGNYRVFEIQTLRNRRRPEAIIAAAKQVFDACIDAYLEQKR